LKLETRNDGKRNANAVQKYLLDLPELGRLSRGEIAALTGVASFNQDSGTLSGQRKIEGGRRRLRRVLYLVTVASVRCNPVLSVRLESHH